MTRKAKQTESNGKHDEGKDKQDRLKKVEKAQQLIALARSEAKNGNLDVARTSAWTAIELMGDAKVVVIPEEVFEESKRRVEGALQKMKDDQFKNLAIGALLGKMLLGNLKL